MRRFKHRKETFDVRIVKAIATLDPDNITFPLLDSLRERERKRKKKGKKREHREQILYPRKMGIIILSKVSLADCVRASESSRARKTVECLSSPTLSVAKGAPVNKTVTTEKGKRKKKTKKMCVCLHSQMKIATIYTEKYAPPVWCPTETLARIGAIKVLL